MLAALDLGTNNCRLMITQPKGDTYEVVDIFSRSVRLGEGIWKNGYISDEAQDRTIEALKECADKLKHYPIRKKKLVATEACRAAKNGTEFIARVKKETGLDLKIISHKIEAQYATLACIPLMDQGYDRAMLFDIGGGSIEMVWLNLKSGTYKKGGFWLPEIINWYSLPLGVVLLAEKFLHNMTLEKVFEETVEEVKKELKIFYNDIIKSDKKDWKSFHLVGTSGTVTTIAALSLGLNRYDRTEVDGLWMHDDIINTIISKIKDYGDTYDKAQGYLGEQRTDLLMPGCAILQAITEFFPQIKMRVADRGIREGIMHQFLIEEITKKHEQLF